MGSAFGAKRSGI